VNTISTIGKNATVALAAKYAAVSKVIRYVAAGPAFGRERAQTAVPIGQACADLLPCPWESLRSSQTGIAAAGWRGLVSSTCVVDHVSSAPRPAARGAAA